MKLTSGTPGMPSAGSEERECDGCSVGPGPARRDSIAAIAALAGLLPLRRRELPFRRFVPRQDAAHTPVYRGENGAMKKLRLWAINLMPSSLLSCGSDTTGDSRADAGSGGTGEDGQAPDGPIEDGSPDGATEDALVDGATVTCDGGCPLATEPHRTVLGLPANGVDPTMALWAVLDDGSSAYPQYLDVEPVWTSEDPGVVVVDDHGVLTPVAAGKTLVKAVYEGHEAQAEVIVSGTLLAGTMKHGLRDRTYLLYVPAGYDGEEPLPLVLGLHG